MDEVLLNPPWLSPLEALEHVRRAYGIEGDGTPLPSERDQNFRLRTIRPPMPFTREDAADLAATLDEVLGR